MVLQSMLLTTLLPRTSSHTLPRKCSPLYTSTSRAGDYLRSLKLVINVMLLLVTTGPLLQKVSGDTLYEYLFISEDYPSYLSKSVEIARLERRSIPTIIDDVNGGAVFLPTNKAWDSNPHVHDAILEDESGDVRYDLFLSSFVEVGGNGRWSRLKQYADEHEGVVTSAFGATYVVLPSGRNGRVCNARWNGFKYTRGECSGLLMPPIELSDTTVYPMNILLIPEELKPSINGLIARRVYEDEMWGGVRTIENVIPSNNEDHRATHTTNITSSVIEASSPAIQAFLPSLIRH